MNVAKWLGDLGLGQYVPAFEANDIDAQTLRQLTDADLIDLGVKSVGHRRKLSAAITDLRESANAEGAMALVAPQADLARLQAEHRQISVIYCDLVGSTAMSARLDAEDYRGLILRFHQACLQRVAEYDGWVANFIGDCVLAYFGWPRAHEDDAERAARAGLAMVHAVSQLEAPGGTTLAVRVGIATGSVVVGDLIREGPAQEQSAIGLAPTVGAQLQALAAPGQVVVDELTRQLLAASFTMVPLGCHTLKGCANPVAAYAIAGERVADSRFDAIKGLDLAPMIGRDQELALLQERWARAQAGEGQVVLLVGEAGVGKSRLARALLDACSAQLPWRTHWQCSPYHTGSALWPVIQRLSRAAGVEAGDPPESTLDKLESVAGDAETAALYATLLGLNGSQRYGPLEMTPQMLRERTLEVLVEHLYDIAEQRPLLLVIEDAHWIDPTTLELLVRCLERIESAPILIVVTSRPDNQPNLGAHPSVTRLSLNRLGRGSVQGMIMHLGGGGLSPQTLATIVAQTDGVPLFVEELTKAVLETGEETIPASLYGSLMARLDGAHEVKEVAQVAACIGRDFDLALLQAVLERPEVIAEALEKLAAAELIFRRRGADTARFAFKHALVQEAACESMLRAQRQMVHARILQVLEAERPDTASEILARHAAGAELTDQAIEHWQRAGQTALAKSAYEEAADNFRRGIALIQSDADAASHRASELELQFFLGQTCCAAQGHAAPSVKAAYQRAEALLDERADGVTRALGVHWGLWSWQFMTGRLTQALSRVEQLLRLASVDGSDAVAHLVDFSAGITRIGLGQVDLARQYLEQPISSYEQNEPIGTVTQFGIDTRAVSHAYAAWALCLQGHATKSKEMLVRARSIKYALPQDEARTRLALALRGVCGRDIDEARTDALALAALAQRYKMEQNAHYAECVLAWADLESGEAVERAISGLERGLNYFSESGARTYVILLRGHFAIALSSAGQRDRALDAIGRAIDDSEEMSLGWCDAELWRLRGTLFLGTSPQERCEAERCFGNALTIARNRGTKLWELRAAVNLARLYVSRGEPRTGADLLLPVLAQFTEGFESADSAEAGAVLLHLGEPLPAGWPPVATRRSMRGGHA